MNKLFLIIVIITNYTVVSLAQSERYTKGLENGYAWMQLDKPEIPYSDNKFKYLGSMLEQNNILKKEYPGHDNIFCDYEINELQKSGKSENFTLEDVIKDIDKFYSRKEIINVPIVFAYCYVIKKETGFSESELKNYINEVLQFCSE